MALISLQNVYLSFGDPALLEDITLQVERNQRVCLMGRNGAGKTTLLKIINGQISPDSGQVIIEKGIKISYFTQEIPEKLDGTVYDIIAQGLDCNSNHKNEGVSVNDRVGKVLSKIKLNKAAIFADLSGGQKRRVILARALVNEPDLILLDEPTNHFDINTIYWLEDFFLKLNCSMIFVTHDRMFLRKLANRIIEIDRGKLISWACDYNTFLKRKQAVLDIEEKEWSNFDKKLSEEEIWIRKGIKARRTRNEGRVRALLKMREQRKTRREILETANIRLNDAQQSGKLVLEAKNISFSYDDNLIINNFSTTIMRGDKIGIIGPNGCGKTTLVNMLIKKLPVKSGTVRHGVNLSILYYDQLREQLEKEKNVKENVLPNGDTVKVNGKSRNIFSYLNDFLFSKDRINTVVKYLSGGERNRLLLARLFTQPSNLLILDEPTNDLDIETLELLEELLVNFSGTLILICHDRVFLNNVVTSTISFNDYDNKIVECVGGYDEWLNFSQRNIKTTTDKQITEKRNIYRQEKKSRQKQKLNFNERRELKELPALIEQLEQEQETLHDKMSDPNIYKDKDKIKKAKERLNTVEAELAKSYERWEYLETIEK